MSATGDTDLLLAMAVALAVGLVVGFERGWHEREAPEGSRVAGIRTFALVGLAGGLVAIIGSILSPLVAASLGLAVAGVLMLAWRAGASRDDVGVTTETGAVTVFALGILAGLGHFVPAIAGAVATAFLLGLKPVLHRWLRGLSEHEVFAALQLVLISAVILPLLPDRGFGPYLALNPYRLWWMVVMVATVSVAGYEAIKLLGPRAGLLLSGLLGGLVASTATTVALSRRAAASGPGLVDAIAAAIVASGTMMLLRLVTLVVIVHPALLGSVTLPFGGAVLAGAGAALWLWRRGLRSTDTQAPVAVGRPLDLRTALGFAALLGVVMVLAEAARAALGPAGLYALSALAGLVDVDAISLSIAQQAEGGLPAVVATTSLCVVAAINTAVKIGIGRAVGSPGLAWRLALGFGIMLATGVAGMAGFMVMGLPR